MRQTMKSVAISFLVALFFVQCCGTVASAQDAVPTAEELDQLLAPVALYPDSLLSQITTASTNPQEILDVDAWLGQNPDLSGTALTDAASKQGFDPAFIALVNFPQVLQMMADHVDDYAAIGTAFSADQGAVSASIQRLRSQAYDAGNLRSNEQQQVEVQQPSAGQTIYVIQPASPQIVYIPQYDPTIVYVRPTVVVSSPLITFGVGIGIGPLLVVDQPWGWSGWGWNWGARRAYYNHGYWGGWGNPYHPPHIWYRPRPIVWANRPGYGGNWGYRPPNYRPPYRPSPRPLPGRPGNSTRNPPARATDQAGQARHSGNASNAEADRPTTPGRPTTQPTKPETPTTPGTTRPTRPGQPGQPGTPGSTRPTRPTSPGGPEAQPTKPGTPSTPGTTRPSRPTSPGGPSAQPTTPGTTRPARPAAPGGPSAQPTKPGDSTRQPSDRTATPGQTRTTPSNRPSRSQPSSQDGGSQQRGSRPAKSPDAKPESDHKPQ